MHKLAKSARDQKRISSTVGQKQKLFFMIKSSLQKPSLFKLPLVDKWLTFSTARIWAVIDKTDSEQSKEAWSEAATV